MYDADFNAPGLDPTLAPERSFFETFAMAKPPEYGVEQEIPFQLSHSGRRDSAPGLRRHSRLMTASPVLAAAAAAANRICLRHQPRCFSSRRLRRISRAIALLRGLNALESTLLPVSAIRDLNLSFSTGPLIRYGFRGNGEAPTRPHDALPKIR